MVCAPLSGAVARLCPVWCSVVPEANAVRCPLCPPSPSQCPRCVGDTPSGCGQSFCSRVQLGSLVFVCLKHVLLARPQPRQRLYDCAVLIAVYHSSTSVSSASPVGDDFYARGWGDECFGCLGLALDTLSCVLWNASRNHPLPPQFSTFW